MGERTHFVVGTAGHVDHGKTSLVLALTGTDCDRLPEEKARGITIDLGFAAFPLPGGLSASVVDVPGHERFVRTMIGGAAGIDLVLLVVAADDGVMPQTREHVDICALLGVRGGVIAITKADMVDEAQLARVVADVHDATRGTFLEGAETIACSVKDRRGLDALTHAIVRALPRAIAPAASGPAFLPIDRVFTKAGAGTVVTGTLSRGTLRVGDELDALPTARGGVARVKVRGLHVHGAVVTEVRAASRVAVNVRGEDEGDLVRGGVLASAGWQAPTRTVLADVTLAKDATPIGKRTQTVLHTGTSHVTAQMTIVAKSGLFPGQSALVRLSTNEPFVAYAGLRIVLRRPDLDANRTIGGGAIVDPHPTGAGIARIGRARADVPSHDAASRVRALVVAGRYAGIDADDVRRRVPPDDDASAALDELSSSAVIVGVGGRFFDAALLGEAKADVLAQLAAFHAAHPMLAGAARPELASRAAVRLRSLAEPAISALLREGRVEKDADVIRLSEHKAAAEVGAFRSEVAAIYARARLAPPLDEEVRLSTKLAPHEFRDALAALKREGKLRLLTGGLHFDVAALTVLKHDVARWFQTNRALTPNDLKAIGGGITRKHAIPLLELLDAEGITKRTGDARIAGPRASLLHV